MHHPARASAIFAGEAVVVFGSASRIHRAPRARRGDMRADGLGIELRDAEPARQDFGDGRADCDRTRQGWSQIAEISASAVTACRQGWASRLIRYIALSLVLIAMYGTTGHAHEAETGWAYAPLCCGDRDCRQALPGEVTLTQTGNWHVATTDETFAPGDPHIRISGDDHIHVCIYQTTINYVPRQLTRCLYIPEMRADADGGRL